MHLLPHRGQLAPQLSDRVVFRGALALRLLHCLLVLPRLPLECLAACGQLCDGQIPLLLVVRSPLIRRDEVRLQLLVLLLS